MNGPAGRQGVQRQIRVFLQAIATGGGKSIEQMTPREARAVLEGLQSSVKVALPQAEVAERIINGGDDRVREHAPEREDRARRGIAESGAPPGFARDECLSI